MILKATEASLDYCEGATSPGRWDESEKQPSESLNQARLLVTLSGGPGEMKLALYIYLDPLVSTESLFLSHTYKRKLSLIRLHSTCRLLLSLKEPNTDAY